MGIMIDGIWHTDMTAMDERFEREEAPIRSRLGSDEHPVAAGRYRLYAHPGCPWAHRTRIVRHLLGLQDTVEEVLVAMQPSMTEGWVFDDANPDPLGYTALHELYAAGASGYTGRCTVPVLWDTLTNTIVNNESSEIIWMLNEAFGGPDLRPEGLRQQIDELNERIYEGLNNGVYRAGFAQSQSAHDDAAQDVLKTLDWLEEMLSDGREYLCGETMTEADVRLWPTLLRFRAYREVFYCDLADPGEHPHVWQYRDRALEHPAVRATSRPENEYVRGYGLIPFAAANNPAIRPSREEVGLAG